MEQYDVLVIGGGAAGMAAALAAAERGRRVLLVERENALGGILNQCLHRGFGLSWYGEDLTGTEYAARFRRTLENAPVTVRTGAEVLEIRTDKTALISAKNALFRVGFAACVLAAGCRERPLGALDVAGTRPAGVFTAGTAQKLVNVGHYAVGSEAVILGSGDVGQIMARQLVQSGRRVVALVEQEDALGGLARNRRDCVEAYRIPVLLRTTVEAVLGAERITGVRLRSLDTGGDLGPGLRYPHHRRGPGAGPGAAARGRRRNPALAAPGRQLRLCPRHRGRRHPGGPCPGRKAVT